MKNILANLKKPVALLSVLAVLLIIMQIAVMFTPYFTLTPKPTRKVPDPTPTDYSLQNYCWTHCEEMSKIFDDMIDDYNINDYVMDLVLVNVFALISLIFLVFEIKHIFTNHKTAGTIAVKIFSNIACLFWGAQSVYTFLCADILAYGNTTIQYICLGISGVGAAVVLARAVITFVNRTRYVVAK